jgi:hypothetical protein
VSPVIILLVVLAGKISEQFGLNGVEAAVLQRSVIVPVLCLIWVPWTHYRAKQTPTRKLGSAHGEFTVPKDFNDPLPKEIEDEFYKG